MCGGKVIAAFQETIYKLEFTSGLKKRGKTVTGEIFCLVDTVTFIDAFSRLRREPDVMEMRGWKVADVDSGKNKTVNRAVRRVFGDKREGGEIIPVAYGETELSCKNLRAAGVNAVYWLHGRDNHSIGDFAKDQLMHENEATAANYEDYYAADANGKKLYEAGVLKDEKLSAKPQSEKRSSVSVDAQLRDMIGDAEQWGSGSHADRLERIIARALQADKLERQLARECEKRQRLEFELERLHPAVEYEPLREDEIIWAKDMAAAKPTGFDWCSILMLS